MSKAPPRKVKGWELNLEELLGSNKTVVPGTLKHLPLRVCAGFVERQIFEQNTDIHISNQLRPKRELLAGSQAVSSFWELCYNSPSWRLKCCQRSSCLLFLL